MFTELGNSLQQIWLTVLLLLWALFLFGGFLFGKPNANNTHRMPTWGRMASSFTLVIAAWSGWLFTRDSSISIFTFLIGVGMTLGFVGDLFMAGLMPVKDFVLGGIGSFGLGHIAYIIAILYLGNLYGLDAATPRWGGLIAWWVAGLIGWYVVVFRSGERTPLHLAALPYALLLATTAGAGMGLALQSSPFISPAIGAALFLLSDLLLAAQLFNHLHFRLIGDVVWLLYGPAQMLIVYGGLAGALILVFS